MKNNNLLGQMDIEEMSETDEVKEIVNGLGKIKRLFKSKMFRRVLSIGIIILTVSSSIWGCTYKIKYGEVKAMNEELSNRLAGYEEKMPSETLTIHYVEERLGEFAELDVAKFEYSGAFTHPDYRKIWGTDIEIWFTKNEVDLKYEGLIEAGYDIDKIECDLDEENKIIKIKLPEANLNNNLLQEKLLYEENNNCLNPISAEEVNKLLVAVKAKHLQRGWHL